jgi:hypothetical protein
MQHWTITNILLLTTKIKKREKSKPKNKFACLPTINYKGILKNVVLWDVTCGSCKNRRFGGKYRFHRQGEKN